MNVRWRAALTALISAGSAAVVITVASLSSESVAGQTPAQSPPAAGAGQGGAQGSTTAAKSWTPTRTSWGHPDLQGIWSNATTTPMERPAELSGKQVLSDEEAVQLDRQVSERRNTDRAPKAGDPGTYNEFWWERGRLLKQTALVVDPADGRIPPLTAEGQKKVSAREQYTKGRGPADSWTDTNLHERCILYHGVPPLPTGYNNNYQILQTPGYVAIHYEMLPETRLIPLDGRPHLGSNIRLYMGDSRGHWEGQTLVVETTNFNYAGGGMFELGRTGLQGSGETIRLVERFTRTGPDSIDYRFTVDDPTLFTKPWTGSIPMSSFEGPIYEYACHEGNYAMRGILAGARAEDEEAATHKK